jgi:hypothetical protein
MPILGGVNKFIFIYSYTKALTDNIVEFVSNSNLSYQ